MESISVLGFDIPVWDYYTAGEREQLEMLIASQDEETKSRYDLEALKIFIESRCKKKVKLEWLLQQPVYGDEIAEAVEVLCDPLFVTLKQRALRREKRRVEQLTDEATLTLMKTQYEMLLEVIVEKLQDVAGQKSEP